MSSGLLIFLQHLREFGLVYQRKVRNAKKAKDWTIVVLFLA